MAVRSKRPHETAWCDVPQRHLEWAHALGAI